MGSERVFSNHTTSLNDDKGDWTAAYAEKKMNWEDPIVAFWEWKCTEGLHELLSTICVWLLWRLVLFSCGNKLSLDTRFGTVNV